MKSRAQREPVAPVLWTVAVLVAVVFWLPAFRFFFRLAHRLAGIGG